MPPLAKRRVRLRQGQRLYSSGPLLLDPIIACIETKLVREGLAYAVHLVVGLSLRKRQQFSFKSGQKVCPHGKKHITAFKFCLVDVDVGRFYRVRREQAAQDPSNLMLLSSWASAIPVEASSISTC